MAPSPYWFTDGTSNFVTNTFEYNDLGEMLSMATQMNHGYINNRQFQFNSDGTLGAIVDSENNAQFHSNVKFKYDDGHNRVYKKSIDKDGVESESFYLFGLFTEKDDVMSNHISDGSVVVASKVAGNDSRVLFSVTNHLGSTVVTTNREGQVLSKMVHGPYGNEWSQSDSESPEEMERQFTNQVYDEETGLYYFNMRYYDPKLGIFISPDPALDGINHYGYAAGNPIHFIDPTGLRSGPVDGGGECPTGGDGPIRPNDVPWGLSSEDQQWIADVNQLTVSGLEQGGIEQSAVETWDPATQTKEWTYHDHWTWKYGLDVPFEWMVQNGVANSLAGLGDIMSGGVSVKMRNFGWGQYWTGNVVDIYSSDYAIGRFSGLATQVAFLFGGMAKAGSGTWLSGWRGQFQAGRAFEFNKWFLKDTANIWKNILLPTLFGSYSVTSGTVSAVRNEPHSFDNAQWFGIGLPLIPFLGR